MSDYIKGSISKGAQSESTTEDTLTGQSTKSGNSGHAELRHGAWIQTARSKLKVNRFKSPLFAFLIVFVLLFAGSAYLFESIDIIDRQVYAIKVIVMSMFAITLGFLLSVWWSLSAKSEEKIREAERIDIEYRELLMSFSDSLFDIINALNTLASKPPRPFVIATEFLLGEYVHLLQSRLQRYGDYIAGLDLDATAFLDEKIRIFEGIRERASLSIRGMPKELETLFIGSLNLDIHKLTDPSAQHQSNLRTKLSELANQQHAGSKEGDQARKS